MKQKILITNHGMPNQFFLESCKKKGIAVDILDLNYANISGSVLDKVSILGDRISFDYEKHKFRIEEEIVKFYQNKKLDYVYPSWFDFQTRSIAHLNTYLNLPGMNFDYVFNVYDKLAYQTILEEAGILLPKIISCFEPYSEEYFYKDFPFPVIAKPVRGTGSLGVKVLRNQEEANEFFANYDLPFNNYCEKGEKGYKHYDYHCLNGNYIVQEFLAGDIISVAGHVVQGNTNVDLVYDIDSAELPYRAETGFTYPSKHDCTKDITKIVEKVISVIGLDNSPFMIDFIFYNGEYYLIDLSPRFSTSAQSLLNYLGEPDYAFNIVNKILNRVDFNIMISECVSIQHLPLEKGTISKICINTEDLIDFSLPEIGTKLYKSRIDLLTAAKGFIAVKDNNINKLDYKIKKTLGTLEVEYV